MILLDTTNWELTTEICRVWGLSFSVLAKCYTGKHRLLVKLESNHEVSVQLFNDHGALEAGGVFDFVPERMPS